MNMNIVKMKVGIGIIFQILFLITTFTLSDSKKRNVPCPNELETVCVKCDCDTVTGFSKCVPMRECPRPITTKSNIKWKKGTATCPFSRRYIAECVSCECSGNGEDQCDMCFALPARRSGQPESVNSLLPQPIDNRLIQYQIDGWSAPEINQ